MLNSHQMAAVHRKPLCWTVTPFPNFLQTSQCIMGNWILVRNLLQCIMGTGYFPQSIWICFEQLQTSVTSDSCSLLSEERGFTKHKDPGKLSITH